MFQPHIYRAANDLLNTQIEMVNTISVGKETYIISVGKTKLFIMNSVYEKVETTIEYQQIERIIISSHDANLFQVHLRNQQEPLPRRVIVHSTNRRALINKIRYSWKTDYLFKNLEVVDLPLFKKDFKDKLVPKSNLPKSPQILLMEPVQEQGYRLYIQKEYKYFYPSEFEKKRQQGVFVHKQNPTCRINVQITDVLPLEILPYMGDRSEIAQYAESFLEAVLLAEQNEIRQQFDQDVPKKDGEVSSEERDDDDDDEDDDDAADEEKVITKKEPFTKLQDYWVINSNCYRKRWNINNDPSEWTAWEIHARTLNRDVFIIILRRKYLPPLMENYQDLAFILYGPFGFSTVNQQTKKGYSFTKGTQQVKNDKECLLEALADIEQEQLLQNIIRGCADSVMTQMKVLNVSGHSYFQLYPAIVKQNLNALVFDEITVQHFQLRMGMYPKFITYGIRFLEAIFGKLMRNPNNYTQDFDSGLYEVRKDQLFKNFAQQLDEHRDYPEQAKNVDEPQELIKIYEHTTFVKEKQTDEHARKKIWNFKLSRYLASCINEGLMGAGFGFKDLVHILASKHCQIETRILITAIIEYCLCLTPSNPSHEAEIMPGNLVTRLFKTVSGKFIYNASVVCVLLECNYFSQEFLLKDLTQLYTDLLLYFLTSVKSQVKASVCKHIIEFSSDLKRQNVQLESITSSFLPLISPLVSLYYNPNRTLCTLACVALYNLCLIGKVFKYEILKDDMCKVFVQRLSTKDANLLKYTLKLIYCLLSVQQFVEKFIAFGLVEEIYFILKGMMIKGGFYQIQSLTLTCAVLRVLICSDHEFWFMDQLFDLLLEVIMFVADEYVLEVQEQESLKNEALFIISKLCTKLNDAIKKINDVLVTYLIESLVGTISNVLAEKIIYILCQIVKEDKDFAQNWVSQQPKILEALKKFDDERVQSANYLFSQLYVPQSTKKR